MHQTFYIDIDEEITSIVEKLRKTEASEAVIVVPKRALLIQSIVNLKLLRKEADSLGLKISIVTQDKLGKMLIKKVGIAIQQKQEDGEEEFSDVEVGEGDKLKRGFEREAGAVELGEVNSQGKRNLEKIGTADYFITSSSDGWDGLSKIKEKEKEKEMANEKNTIKKKPSFSMDVASPVLKNEPLQDSNQLYAPKQKEMSSDAQLEKFFYANNFANKNTVNQTNKKSEEAEAVSGKFSKVIVIFGAFCVVVGLMYIAFLYIPKATITIFAKKEVQSADLEFTGEVNYENIDYEKLIIPAKLMEFDEEVVKTFEATGEKSASNQKAKGKITIYNEFSSSVQPLVATTRFLSENQKIFRLVQGVTIPGTTKVGNEIKPGVVEVEVIADEVGDVFNIEAMNFTIPGFKNSGNEKYAKIYAKSQSPMTGGGSGNGSDSVKVISDKDISNAKDSISLEINDAIKNKIKESTSGVIIRDEAITVEEPLYRVSNSVNEVADKFEIKATAHAQALVFSENDVKKMANANISKLGNGKINIDSGSIIIDYEKINADFKQGVVSIKMHASSVMQPSIDLAKLKKDILGKNNDELGAFLKTYSVIDKAEVEYFPQIFVSKIPSSEKRVEIILNAIMPE
jgi:hypothetical protein